MATINFICQSAFHCPRPVINQIEKVQMTARLGRWTCRRWQNTSCVGEMLDKLQIGHLLKFRPIENWSSLILFHKFHCEKN